MLGYPRVAVTMADTQIAARTLYLLNRYARALRRGERSMAIYALKQRLLRFWYEAGFCTGVCEQEQILTCWDCGGEGMTGWYGEPETCERCMGSGVYASHRLYLFEFDFGGERYQWHQLAKAVDWPVALSDLAVSPYDDQRRGGDYVSLYELYPTYVALLGAYLAKAGA